MHSKEFLVPYDLYGRNATRFINQVTGINGNIWITSPNSDRRCDAKSLLGLLSMGIKKDTTICVYTDSDNFQEVFKYVVHALHSLE